MGQLASLYGDTALVTGASSGFGREFARELAAEGLKNIVIVARRENRLNALAEELREKHDTRVLVVRQDLTESGAVKNVMDKVRDAGWKIDLLINNVGKANYGWFGQIDIDRELAMIDLNCKVPVELAYHCLPHMKEQGRGGIINMSGLMDVIKAGTLSAYCGTKAFASVFSECLTEELSGSGIDVLCISPGYNPSTEAYEVAGIPGTFPFPKGNPTLIVRRALRALPKRKVKKVDGIFNNVLVVSLKFTPPKMRQFINRKLMGTPEERLAAN